MAGTPALAPLCGLGIHSAGGSGQGQRTLAPDTRQETALGRDSPVLCPSAERCRRCEFPPRQRVLLMRCRSVRCVSDPSLYMEWTEMHPQQ